MCVTCVAMCVAMCADFLILLVHVKNVAFLLALLACLLAPSSSLQPEPLAVSFAAFLLVILYVCLVCQCTSGAVICNTCCDTVGHATLPPLLHVPTCMHLVSFQCIILCVLPCSPCVLSFFFPGPGFPPVLTAPLTLCCSGSSWTTWPCTLWDLCCS